MAATSKKSVAICILRNDLRLHDNIALTAANNSSCTHLLPIYCFDPRQMDLSRLPGSSFAPPKTWYFKFDKCGKHRARFILEGVIGLKNILRSVHNTDLSIHFGHPESVVRDVITKLAQHNYSVEGVYMQKEVTYEENLVERNISKVLKSIKNQNVNTSTIGLKLLWGLTMVHLQDIPFNSSTLPDVFTEFRKAVERLGEEAVRPIVMIPEGKMKPFPTLAEPLQPSSWGTFNQNPDKLFSLLVQDYDRDMKLGNQGRDPRSAFPFDGSERSAVRRVDDYLYRTRGIDTYKATRNGLKGTEYSSKFSPWLATGAISPRYIMHEIRQVEKRRGGNDGTYWLWFELLWRDYFKFVALKYGNQLFKLEGLRPSTYDTHTIWRKDAAKLKAWIEGKTGIPWVDANMIELKKTGFMSNRGRQNVASFLTKDLSIDWRLGAEYFESQLIDHDPASNYGNWQYVAGVGNDPRENRTFNMIKQATDYDRDGQYVLTWLPQLSRLPRGVVHTPWKASARDRQIAGIGMITDEDDEDEGYPMPILVKPNWSFRGM
ncbi:hypothetical protein HDU76_008627 [Blyttiomyces sp. JEL0837]|nr:hypothetical protein HDU76_008627 [Blyttiomyces sp. JEL0837]